MWLFLFYVNFKINIKCHTHTKKHILLWSWNKLLPLDQILRRQMFYFWMTCTIGPGMCIWKEKKFCMDGIWKKLTCNRLLHNLYCVFICSILCRVSAPEQVFLPIANWQPKDKPVLEDDIGPLVQHIYEVINAANIIGQKHYISIKLLQWIVYDFVPICCNHWSSQLRNRGPSTFSKGILDVQWPYRFNNGSLLYITKFEVDGNMNCSSNRELNPLNVTVCIPQSIIKVIFLICTVIL